MHLPLQLAASGQECTAHDSETDTMGCSRCTLTEFTRHCRQVSVRSISHRKHQAFFFFVSEILLFILEKLKLQRKRKSFVIH